MKKFILFTILILFFIVLISSSKKSKDSNSENNKQPTFSTQKPIEKTRSFYMGFSSWPPDFEVESINKSFELTNLNSDIRLLHFDGGVPWVEMANNESVPKRIMDSWSYTKNQNKTKKIFIAITPLNSSRTDLALYANSVDDNQPLPENWSKLALNDPEVKKAYLEYAKNVIRFWQPDYLAIGIEVNILTTKNLEKWSQYVDLHKFIYTELKKTYPKLPIFASIQLENFKGLTDDSKNKSELQKQEITKIIDYTDILALSVYPYYTKNGAITENYFEDVKLFNKPLAIAETGWPSKNFKISGTTIKGSEQDQGNYLAKLLQVINKNNFLFVINWVNVDYNKLLEKLNNKDLTALAQAWVHDGLWYENFQEKPALQVWQNYLQLEKK